MYTSVGISVHSFQKILQKTITVLFFINAALSQQLLAQLSENFSDGDFTGNPVWNGSEQKFVVSSQQLRLQAPVVNDVAYLSTSSEAINDAAWEFFVRLEFNPSSTNFARIYLAADNRDLAGTLNGYFVMVGNTTDEISLYRQTGLTRVKIIDGADGRLNLSAPSMKIKVTRDASGNWELFSDIGLLGIDIPEGSVNDETHRSSHYFGIYCEYTSTRSDKFYFDDLLVTGSAYADDTPPALESIQVLSATQLQLTFSETLEETSGLDVANYELAGHGHPTSVSFNGHTVSLDFNRDFINGVQSFLTIRNLTDPAGNKMAEVTESFLFFHSHPVNFKDVVINEIFPDYTPITGLPESEFIELFNTSLHPIDLAEWRLTDGTSVGTFVSSFILLPGAYVIVCPNAAQTEFQKFGQTLSPSNFPTLNNTRDKLWLKRGDGIVIDSVEYLQSWYNDEDKAEGGWSLELIDPANLCKGSDNWTASRAVVGGTPGTGNSVLDPTPDTDGPRLEKITMVSDTVLVVTFNETMQSEIPAPTSFSFTPVLRVNKIKASEDRKGYLLELADPVAEGKMYSLLVTAISDCPGNLIDPGFNGGFLNRDSIPPAVDSVKVLSENEIALIVSEKLAQHSADVNHFSIVDPRSAPSSVSLDTRTLRLWFDFPFESGVRYQLAFSLTDINYNSTIDTVSFLYFEDGPVFEHDVILTEIFADPSPSRGLPENEFLEILNRSPNAISLDGWTLGDGNGTCALPAGILLPGEYATLCSVSAASGFRTTGRVIAVSKFPGLSNAGEPVFLKSPSGVTIDSLNFTEEWYRDDEAAEGGVSLELIDPANVCAEESNWTASTDPLGGTPGRENSVIAEKPDLTGPELVSAIPQSPGELLLRFNEKLANTPPSPGNVQFTPPLKIETISFSDRSLKEMVIKLSEEIQSRVLYTVAVGNLYDCAGNPVPDESNSVRFALPERAVLNDVVINELLFNPHPSGVDFIELYNRSEKFIDLRGWQLANGDSVASRKTISGSHWLLSPMSFVVISSDGAIVQNEYPQSAAGNFLPDVPIPTMHDDTGALTLTDSAGLVVDSLVYDDGMHSAFLMDPEGVSLERISADGLSLNAANWTSANASSGYGTPGYVNSNTASARGENGMLEISPAVFQPRDGVPNFTQIHYQFDKGGYVGSIGIFDSRGRKIKDIASNVPLGAQGFFTWEGDTDGGDQARIGSYMVRFQFYDDAGNLSIIRKQVVVASRF